MVDGKTSANSYSGSKYFLDLLNQDNRGKVLPLLSVSKLQKNQKQWK